MIELEVFSKWWNDRVDRDQIILRARVRVRVRPCSLHEYTIFTTYIHYRVMLANIVLPQEHNHFLPIKPSSSSSGNAQFLTG